MRIANRVMRRRDAVPLHEFLGEAFARFQLRGRLGRTEDAPAAAREFVHHSQLQRQFGADHGQIRLNLVGQRHQRVDALDVHRAGTRLRRRFRHCRGRNNTCVTRGDCRSFQTSACSRPPLPMTRTFIA